MDYALIAGAGDLPVKILEKLKDKAVLLIIFENNLELINCLGTLSKYKQMSLGQIGSMLKELHANKIKNIIFAGHIKKPSLKDLNLDFKGVKWLAKIGMSSFGKDDALLKGITKQLEKEGFSIISPHSIVDDLRAPKGFLTIHKPSKQALSDIERGKAILNALSDYDVAQCIVIQNNSVLGIEAVEGTAALIKRCIEYKNNDGKPVLIKLAKINQTENIDLPTIGYQTISDLAEGGYEGVCIEASKTQFLNKAEAIQLANDRGLFILAV